MAVDAGELAKAESYLLRASRPDIILRYYKELGMWPEALRIASDYLPNLMAQLQDEYETVQLKSGAKGAESLLAQARDWEQQGEYDRAIGCLMRVREPLTADHLTMLKAWTRVSSYSSFL